MNNNFKSTLFVTAAIISLGACSGTKGPGEIGSRNDIAVINKGIDGAKMPQPFAGEGDFTTTTEQMDAIPTQKVEQAPVENTPEMDVKTKPAEVLETPDLAVAPAQVENPVQQTQPQPPQPPQPPQEQTSSVYPAQDKPVLAATPAPIAAPTAQQVEPTPQPVIETPVVAAPTTPSKTVPYPLDPNAPYSPTAIAKAQEAAAAVAETVALVPVATTPALSASGINLNDPAIIRAVQSKLADNSMFIGGQTGIMDAALLNAVVQYQVQNKLPVGNLNEDTLKHLGIIE